MLAIRPCAAQILPTDENHRSNYCIGVCHPTYTVFFWCDPVGFFMGGDPMRSHTGASLNVESHRSQPEKHDDTRATASKHNNLLRGGSFHENLHFGAQVRHRLVHPAHQKKGNYWNINTAVSFIVCGREYTHFIEDLLGGCIRTSSRFEQYLANWTCLGDGSFYHMIAAVPSPIFEDKSWPHTRQDRLLTNEAPSAYAPLYWAPESSQASKSVPINIF